MKAILISFGFGLFIGLIFAGWALHSWWNVKRRLRDEKKAWATEKEELETTHKSEIDQYKTTINNVNLIQSDKNRELERKREELREENEKLRIKVQSLENEPSHTDHLKFEQQEKAIALLQEYVPGFAQCWPMALRAAQNEDDKEITETFIEELKRLVSSSAGLLPGNTSEATDTPA